MIQRQVGALLEGQAVKLVGGEEHAVLEHVLHLEVGLELRLVEVEFLLAHLLGVVRPVPGLQLELAAFGLSMMACMSAASFFALATAGRRELGEHLVDGIRRLRGLVFQHVGGVVGIAQHGRAFGAQLGDGRDDAGVVEFVAAAAARDRGLVQLLARGAVGQLRFRRLAGGVEQGDDVLAVELAGLGGLRGGGDLLVGQAIEFFLRVDHDGRIVDLGQHVLAELGAERGQFAVDLACRRALSFSDRLAPARTKSVW